ncbi:MAG TPA: Ig-like domain-containing protein [Bacteroidales bacterium]|nr:Ig-like domain-containing protein [Bacteroidales bacterium]
MKNQGALIFVICCLTVLSNTAFCQCDCYGEWEYVPNSGTMFTNVFENDFEYEYMEKLTINENLPNILIEKDVIYCDYYVVGEYNSETGWEMSRTPKYEDGFMFLDGNNNRIAPSSGYNCFKRIGSVQLYPNNYKNIYKSLDVLGRLKEDTRFISNCDEYTTPNVLSYFNCCTGDYIIIDNYGNGSGEIKYFKYVKKGEQVKSSYAIKAGSNPKEIKTDGKSTTEINAQLYEFIDGVESSGKPVSGKVLNFQILDQYGKTPGSLSASTAITDENGIAKVIYKSPDAARIEDSLHLINTATIKVSQNDFNIEDIVYINFVSDRAKVFVEPSNGLISSYGIVPPDKRYPAKIRVYFENENLEPKTNAEVYAEIKGEKTVGKLRAKNGTESNKLTLSTDNSGFVEFYYFYSLNEVSDNHIIEEIEIKTTDMVKPVTAKISIGLNLVIEKLENKYEGKGVINAGEQIPIMIKIKDIWNPDADLSEIINYWGIGGDHGNDKLYLYLEIKNNSYIPEYLMDYLRESRFPEKPFKDKVEVRSFKDKKEYNILWISESSLNKYGYPVVTPSATGNHYYEAEIKLTDQNGQEILNTKNSLKKSYFNLTTGLAADAIYIYFIQNPLKPQTREAEVFAYALNLMGMGTLISVVDAMDAINKGDTDALYNTIFSEIKSYFFDLAKDKSPDFKITMDAYSRICIAENIVEEMKRYVKDIDKDYDKLLSRLVTSFDGKTEQLIILKGNGNQKLSILDNTDKGEEGVNLFKGKINIKIDGVDDKTKENVSKIIKPKDKFIEVPAYENKLYYDNEKRISSLKSGNHSFYIIPTGMEYQIENTDQQNVY